MGMVRGRRGDAEGWEWSGSGVGGSEGESGDGRCTGEERRRVGIA